MEEAEGGLEFLSPGINTEPARILCKVLGELPSLHYRFFIGTSQSKIILCKL